MVWSRVGSTGVEVFQVAADWPPCPSSEEEVLSGAEAGSEAEVLPDATSCPLPGVQPAPVSTVYSAKNATPHTAAAATISSDRRRMNLRRRRRFTCSRNSR